MAALALAGCATEKIDWTARIGHYTCDQAVMDFGPPDKSARLSDGTTVDEWMTDRGETMIMPEDEYFAAPRHRFDPIITTEYSETYYPPRHLRLTFGANGILTEEKDFSK